MATKTLSDRTIATVKPPKSGRLELWDTVVPSFGLRVTDKGARSYFVMYRTGIGEARQQKRLKIGDAKLMSLADAREVAREALRKAARGDDPAEDKPTPPAGVRSGSRTELGDDNGNHRRQGRGREHAYAQLRLDRDHKLAGVGDLYPGGERHGDHDRGRPRHAGQQ